MVVKSTSGNNVEQSRVTVRGYLFLTEIIDRRHIVLIDPQRGGKRVARAPMTPEAAKYSVERDKLQRKLARLVLDYYEAQHRNGALGVTFEDGAEMSDLELKKGLGLTVDRDYLLGPKAMRPGSQLRKGTWGSDE